MTASISSAPCNRRSRPLLLWPLVLCSLVVLRSDPAAAQFQWWVPLETDRYVVDKEFKRHTPEAGVRKSTKYLGGFRWRTTHTLSLFAVTQWGLSSRYWDTDSRSWSIWEPLGNPSGAPVEKIDQKGADPGWDTTLRIFRGWMASSSSWVGYFGFRKPGSSVANPPPFTAMPDMNAPSASMVWDETYPRDASGNELRTAGVSAATNPRHRDFRPQAGFSEYDLTKRSYRHHVFGSGLPRGYIKTTRFHGVDVPLLELRREESGRTEEWIDHGAPAGHNAIDVGSASAVSVMHDFQSGNEVLSGEQHYVFVAVDPAEAQDYGDGYNGTEVFYRVSSDGRSWRWESLGAPDGIEMIYGAPAAAAYYTAIPAAGGKGRIVVYVAGRNPAGDWELWQQYHNGGGWQGWSKIGAPPGTNGNKFKLTSSLVWYEGVQNDWNALRISFFGYSEKYGGRKGKLVEWVWDGGSWHFNPTRTAPDAESLRTTSAVVVDEGSRDRVSVFTRSEDGRIWEFAREHQNGGATETWRDLSFEPLLRIIP